MGKLNLEDLGRSDLLFGPQKPVYEAKNTRKKIKIKWFLTYLLPDTVFIIPLTGSIFIDERCRTQRSILLTDYYFITKGYNPDGKDK